MRGRPQRPPTGIETVMQVFARRLVLMWQIFPGRLTPPPLKIITHTTIR